ncbi:MAG: ATP-binding cassette domain-containing protein [Candidatus Aminicenantes bacterium]|nr:ATP-binding cassette domain-containing protein [Candidatus Aminicenantes bacterium]
MTPKNHNRKQGTIDIKNLCFSYEKDHPVLRGVNISIHNQERFGIIGPSGAGKSTLLLHLNGILYGQGTVRVGGREVNKDTAPEIRSRVGMVFQNPDDQLFNPTVEEDIAFGPLNMGLGPDEVRRRVKETLEEMRLQGYEKKTSHHLSFGERKRVALATVLAMRPEIVAFDEPFSNLDPSMVEQLLHIIKDLPATVVIVSQEIIPVAACCGRVAVLKEGQIITTGPSYEVVRDKDLLRSCSLDLSIYESVCKKIF